MTRRQSLCGRTHLVLGRKGVPRAYAVLRQAARRAGRAGGQGSCVGQKVRVDDSSLAPQGSRSSVSSTSRQEPDPTARIVLCGSRCLLPRLVLMRDPASFESMPGPVNSVFSMHAGAATTFTAPRASPCPFEALQNHRTSFSYARLIRQVPWYRLCAHGQFSLSVVKVFTGARQKLRAHGIVGAWRWGNCCHATFACAKSSSRLNRICPLHAENNETLAA